MKLAPFKLERYFAKHEFTAPYLLCSSDCESMSIGDLLALESGASDQLNALWLGYTESLGHPDLRLSISRLYDTITADQVLVHAGAEEAIFNFMHVVLSPGDHVVVHAPYYQSLGEVALNLGAEVSEWQGHADKAWALDLDDLAQAVTDRTKLVVVNFPHNPTGFLPTADFLQELSAMADTHGFMVFSDEVYRGLEIDPAHRLPAFADINARAASLGVMSKTYGLAGLRIGWIATQDNLLYEKMAAFKDYTTICNSAPSEFLAMLALRHASVIVERNLNIIRNNLDQLDRFFSAHEGLFTWHRPKAGSVALPVLRQGGVDTFCNDLVAKSGVLLLPGTLFREDLNAFRIGFGRKNLPQALDRLEDFLQTY